MQTLELMSMVLALLCIANANAHPPNIQYEPQKFWNGHSSTVSISNTARYARSRDDANTPQTPPIDLCTVCSCAKPNSFKTITCDFNQIRNINPDFGSNYAIPEHTTAIEIILGPNTRSVIKNGFFKNTIINRLSIRGSNNSNQQIEIAKNAFTGNNGPNPEIQIHNIYTVFIRNQGISAENVNLLKSAKVSIKNCHSLYLETDAFKHLQIHGEFINIKDMRIEERAFNSAKAKIRIEDSHIENLYRFEASLQEIRFMNCSITTINDGTFDVNSIESIVFEKCFIEVINGNAITEKLHSGSVIITNNEIGSIEKEAFNGSGITELKLFNNTIKRIHQDAIYVNSATVNITQNNLHQVDNDWLHINNWQNLIMNKNRIGVYGKISLENAAKHTACSFSQNHISKPLPDSLNMNCTFREIFIDIPCQCSLTRLNEISKHDLRSEAYCTLNGPLADYCFQSKTFNTLRYINVVCDENQNNISCKANRMLYKNAGNFLTTEELDQQNNNSIKYWIMAVIVIVIMLALLLILIYIIKRLRCAKKSKQIQTHKHEFSSNDQTLIRATVGQIKKEYPEFFNEFNTYITKLLQPNLTDKTCSNIISKILDLLHRKNIDIEAKFSEFNNLLKWHSNPDNPSAPPIEPVYAEPGIEGFDNGGGFYTSSSIIPVPRNSFYASANIQNIQGSGEANDNCAAQSPPEHIYAEPNQPLLRNEYASPADKRQDGNMDLYTYSDPISTRDPMPPPHTSTGPPQYAIPMKNLQANKLPIPTPRCIDKNLPDVLHQSVNALKTSPKPNKSLSNVQKMAQNLQNMPKFQLPQLPNDHRQKQHLVAPPSYSVVDHAQSRAKILPAVLDEELDMRGATALPTADSSSNHSGGSNETAPMDDIIEYADA